MMKPNLSMPTNAAMTFAEFAFTSRADCHPVTLRVIIIQSSTCTIPVWFTDCTLCGFLVRRLFCCIEIISLRWPLVTARDDANWTTLIKRKMAALGWGRHFISSLTCNSTPLVVWLIKLLEMYWRKRSAVLAYLDLIFRWVGIRSHCLPHVYHIGRSRRSRRKRNAGEQNILQHGRSMARLLGFIQRTRRKPVVGVDRLEIMITACAGICCRW